MPTDSKDRLETLLENWTSEFRWLNAFGARLAELNDPIPCDVRCPLADLDDPEITNELASMDRAIESAKKYMCALIPESSDEEILPHEPHKPPKRRTGQQSQWSYLLPQYEELRELLQKEAPFLLGKLPIIERPCTKRIDFCAKMHAKQVKYVLKHLRNNKEIERRELVNAKDLAAYFGKTIGAMRMKLNRTRTRISGCYVDRPEQGEQRTRTDCFLYRTAIILAELKK